MAFFHSPLFFKLQQDVLKFKISVSWSLPKSDLETTFLNLGNRSFENVIFSQQKLFKAIFDNILLINLSISLINLRHTIKSTCVQIFFELELPLRCFSLFEI